VANNTLLNMLASQAAEGKREEPNTLLINSLIPYSAHPFSLYEGERLSDMVESIKANGVLLPVIVRPIEGESEYEMLSGHNRVNAARIAGLVEIPAIVKADLSEDEAKLIVTETNLIQRSFSDLSHSERAIVLKTHMDAIKAQGKRTDIINEVNSLLNADEQRVGATSALLEPKLAAREKTAQKYGLCRANVSRYIKLNDLNSELLTRVDNGEIGIYPAVSLSYLTHEEQEELNTMKKSHTNLT